MLNNLALETLDKKTPMPDKIPCGLFLHIGCDIRKLKNFINVDVRKTPATDIVANCWSITGVENNTVAFIYSRHTIEHISLNDARSTFSHWFNLLKSDGGINIIVPDIEFHARQILGLVKSNFTDQMQHACSSIWGWQMTQRGGTQTDNHLWGYTFETLKKELSKAGFINIERFIKGDDNEPWHLNVTAQKP